MYIFLKNNYCDFVRKKKKNLNVYLIILQSIYNNNGK